MNRKYGLATVFVVLLISMGTALNPSAFGLSSFAENKVEFVFYANALVHIVATSLWFWVGTRILDQEAGAALGKSSMIWVFGFSGLIFPSFFTSSKWTLICCVVGIVIFFVSIGESSKPSVSRRRTTSQSNSESTSKKRGSAEMDLGT